LFKAVLFIIVGGILLMVGSGVYFAFSGAAETMDPDRPPSMSSPLLFTIGTGLYLIILLAVYLFAVRQPGSSWAELGVRRTDGRWFAAAFGLLFVQFAGMALINLYIIPLFTGSAFENPQAEQITGGLALSPTDLLLLLLLIAVVAPIVEELFFRGMLYPVMRRRWGVPWAIGLNALAFALIHFIPLLIPALFFVGLVLAWVRQRSNSVLPGIFLHALQNGLVVYAIYLTPRLPSA